jgi:hypothetical protein
MIEYIEKVWLPMGVRQQWAVYFTSLNLNFGAKTTSPSESGNNTIKSYLLNGRGSFLTVYKALSEMTQAQSKIYDEALANDRARIPMRFLGQEYLGELPCAISFHALKLIEQEHAIALKAIPSRSRPYATIQALGDCRAEVCKMRGQYGLPCRHEIARKMNNKEGLRLDEVHQHWHLESRLEDENRYASLKNPLPAPRGRGRPKKTKKKNSCAQSSSRVAPLAQGVSRLQPDIRRDRSAFEMRPEPEQPDVATAGELLGVTVVRPQAVATASASNRQDGGNGQGQRNTQQTQDEAILSLLQPTRRSARTVKPSRTAAEAEETARLVAGAGKRRRLN